ncbi:NAAT family transporter [Methylovulum psychrotolerans]|nr:NAAT family transporter [Methylovulum psychrotolerans]
MAALDEYIKLLAGLLSVVDPIAAIPLFISLTEHRDEIERRHIAWVCATSVAAVLLFALLGGKPILALFGISIPSFQIAGGIVIFLMGISMLKAAPDRSRNTPEERAESFDKESIAVVPLAIPLLSGPGAMSTVIVYHNLNPSWAHDILAVSVIITVALAVLLCLLMAKKMAEWLGTTGINVITRVFGLIILSIAVEFIVKGVSASFHLKGVVS